MSLQNKKAVCTKNPEIVHVGIIVHKYGRNIYIHKTMDGLNKALDEYIREEWNETMLGRMPEGDSKKAMNERYAIYEGAFEQHEESFDVSCQEIEE